MFGKKKKKIEAEIAAKKKRLAAEYKKYDKITTKLKSIFGDLCYVRGGHSAGNENNYIVGFADSCNIYLFSESEIEKIEPQEKKPYLYSLYYMLDTGAKIIGKSAKKPAVKNGKITAKLKSGHDLSISAKDVVLQKVEKVVDFDELYNTIKKGL